MEFVAYSRSWWVYTGWMFGFTWAAGSKPLGLSCGKFRFSWSLVCAKKKGLLPLFEEKRWPCDEPLLIFDEICMALWINVLQLLCTLYAVLCMKNMVCLIFKMYRFSCCCCGWSPFACMFQEYYLRSGYRGHKVSFWFFWIPGRFLMGFFWNPFAFVEILGNFFMNFFLCSF